MKNRRIRFKCTECRRNFRTARGNYYATTTLPLPQKCPYCGGRRTRPASFLLANMYDAIYKGIWESLKKNE